MTQPERVSSSAQLADPLRSVLAPAYIVTEGGEQKIAMHLPAGVDSFNWQISSQDEWFEQSGEQRVVVQQERANRHDPAVPALYQFNLPGLPAGRFTLTVQTASATPPTTNLADTQLACLIIVAPLRCYVPPQMEARAWGPFVRLSALRSPTNWGVGDLSDLGNLCKRAVQSGGAAVIALEPLQTVVSDERRGKSPILYSSLSFIDPLYIDVQAVSDYDASEEAKRTVLAPDFQERLKHLRECDQADCTAVRELKLKALRLLYQKFRSEDLKENNARAGDFVQFKHARGRTLYLYSLYEALAENAGVSNWPAWPKQYQSPDTDAVRDFEQSNPERIEFFQYLQWQADIQLKAVGDLCANLKTSLGLCYSIPSAIDPMGCEAWQNQELIAADVKAQTSSTRSDLPIVASAAALIPERLLASGFQLLVDAFRNAQRYSGAVYFPDIVAFEHKRWIDDSDPQNDKAKVVQHHFDEMLALLKIESHRGKCAVMAAGWERLDESHRLEISEVEPTHGILPVMSEFTYGTEVFAEPDRTADASVPVAALPMADGNHSLVGFWFGADVQPEGSPLDVDKTLRDALVAQRVLERVDLLRQLEKQSLLPDNLAIDPSAASVLGLDVSTAFYKMLAARAVRLLFIPLEDIAGRHVLERTVNTYSMSERLAVNLSEIFEQPDVADLMAYLEKEGKRSLAALDESSDALPAVPAAIPDATYRLQFNKSFTMQDAYELIPYLHQLGISHVYAAPLLKARPGSMHGYDIVQHSELNAEIGNADDFDRLVEMLHRSNMGVILDMVPNHMGIGKENAWWMDVLENGPASQFADYFDIDWSPIKPELRGKVTIPILGEFYGTVLHSGQLKLHFYPERGALVLRYFDNEYPLNPLTYPEVLGERINVLKERLGADNFDVMEYLSIITAFRHLPGHMEPAGFSERIREKQLQMRRLAELCRRNAAVVEFIEQNLQLFAVQDADRVSRSRLHKLLEAQAYRLVHWRVANDEINYRRFFDINDLAAVRTEDARVFSEMHELIFKWIAEHKIDGLRIDHPDGLLDPANYFQQLQQSASERLGRAAFHSERRDGIDLPFYITVEKILAPFERIEQDWAVQGTTGYDFLNEVLNILVRPESEEEFTLLYDEFLGHKSDYEQMKLAGKRIILESVLASELNVLAHRLSQIAESSWYFRDFTLNSLRQALRQIVIHFPVYRTYVTADGADKSARQFIDWAVGKAMRAAASNNTAVFNFIRQVLTLEASASPLEEDSEENRAFKKAVTIWAMKFQQFTGPVMAKSVEDTLFYRYTRLACLNEVGGEPERFGASVSAFHQKNQQRQQRHPFSMLATSTHDTKRSEDVRARLAVLSELPNVWKHRINYWLRLNRSKKANADGDAMPDANDEYLIYQTISGARPLTMSGDEEIGQFRSRIQQYMLKAAREAKRFTSWVNQNEEYESALNNFIERILTPSSTNPFLDDLCQFQSVVAPLGLLNSLVQTVLKLTCPGVPDIYQGTELWDFSLVDPDNRRPVDYKLRCDSLEAMEQHVFQMEHLENGEIAAGRKQFAGDCLKQIADGRLKLYLTACLLRYRREKNQLFGGGKYVPLEVTGKAALHVVAFARQHDHYWAVVVVPHLIATLLQLDQVEHFGPIDTATALSDAALWEDTRVILPAQIKKKELINLFTSEKQIADNGQLLLSEMFTTLPVCVLIA